MKSLLIIAASAASAGLLVPTLAEARTNPGYEQVSKTVRYHDLDLTTAKGLAVLDRRIGAALREICGDPDQRDLAFSAASRECISGGRDDVSREIRFAVRQAQVRKGSA